MSLDLSLKIDRVENISRKDFQQNYMKPQKPVIIKHLFGKDAEIYNWTFDKFKKELGHIDVGIFDAEGKKRKDDRSYKTTDDYMNFGEYLDLIQKEPTTKRLFLFNVFKHKPELKKDFYFPDITDNVIRFLPLAFFGGKGAETRIHQDMDMSNVFLTEIVGRKRIVLFDPKYSELLYRYPFSVHTSIDVNNPDYNRYPGLRKVVGYDCYLEAGETIFMPSGWWHHIEYHKACIGVAMRSLSPSFSTRLKGLYKVGVLTHVDDLLRNVIGDKWQNYKVKIAEKRAKNQLTEMS